MQGNSAETVLLQVVSQAVALDLRARKHDSLVDGGVTQPVVQQLALVLGVVGPEQHLLDVGVLFLRAVDGDALWLAHHAGSQLLNARREGRAEHHRLLTAHGQLVEFGQIVRETQVQHAVGFVDDQEADLVQLDLHRALQVEQTAWRGDNEVGVLQLGDLQLVRHAADHVGNAQTAAMLDEFDSVVSNLLCEFACRANDQRAWLGSLEMTWVRRVLALGFLRTGFATGDGFSLLALVLGALGGFGIGLLLQQRVQHGQQESGGLAAAGLARHHQVDETDFAFSVGIGRHSERNGFFLHGGRLGVAEVGTGLHQFRRQAQEHEAIWLGRLCGFGRLDGFRRNDFCRNGFCRNDFCGHGGFDVVKTFDDDEFVGNDKDIGNGFRSSEFRGGLHRREFALHFKSVGHEKSQARATALRKPVGWSENINHPTTLARLYALLWLIEVKPEIGFGEPVCEKGDAQMRSPTTSKNVRWQRSR